MKTIVKQKKGLSNLKLFILMDQDDFEDKFIDGYEN